MLRPGVGRALAIAAAALAAVVHAARWPGWWVEDAAIAFAYARNVADGWGLVPFPGGERVEGYSDPLWVALLALGEVLGFDGFTTAKPLAFGCVAVAVVATAAAGRRLGPGVGIAAAVGLAASSTFAIWAASGLENALFGALLAVGTWRTLAEAEDGGAPWSAAAFLGLAVTRPEGVVYAAVAWAWGVAVRRDRRAAATWALAFGAPFAAYHGARIAYFAQELPATYHAKLGELRMDVLDWDRRGWRQLRRYLLEVGVVGLVPWLAVGVAGVRGRRAAAGWAAVVGLALLAAPLPDVAKVALVGLLAVGVVPAARAPGPVLAWALLGVGLAFQVRSDGDWMRGFRWVSLVQVPAVLLLASAGAAVAERIRWPAWAVLGAAWIVPNLAYTAAYVPETSPHSVLKRVVHYHEAKLRLGLDRPYTALDHDMGAMLWWGHQQGRIRDARGLTDLAFALHHRETAFLTAELYDRPGPDFAHGHAHAGNAMRRGGPFYREYIEFPGYPTSDGKLHVANHVRKDLLVADTWDRPPVRFGGLDVYPPRLRAPEVSPGSGLEVVAAWGGRPAGARALWFLAGPDGAVHAFDLPPGFDDWYPPSRWREGDVVHGTFPVGIPEHLPLGTYDLGVVVFDADGAVVPAVDAEGGSAPVLAVGEHRWAGVVELVARDRMYAEADADLARARAAAKALDCPGAEAAWADARAHRIRSGDWQATRRPPVARAIARCWAKAALAADPLVGAGHLERARVWDFRAPVVWTAGARVADRLEACGDDAWGEDAGRAFDCHEGAVRADPRRAWARRWAEKVRAEGW